MFFDLLPPWANDAAAQRMLMLVGGRQDVYAEKWISKSGAKGYSPACANKFSDGCALRGPRSDGKKGSCTYCTQKMFIPLTEDVVRSHLAGIRCVGTYLVDQNGCCSCAVVDIDDHSGGSQLAGEMDSPLGLGAKIVFAANELGLSMFLERSGGGLGAHVWVFFRLPIPAQDARLLLGGILAEAGTPRGRTVEIFPKQDFVGSDGLGNLIALPFQGSKKVRLGCSVFVDPDTLRDIPVIDSLVALSNGRNSPDKIEEQLRQFAKSSVVVPAPVRHQNASERTSHNLITAPLVRDPIAAVYAGCAALRRIRQRANGHRIPLPGAQHLLTHGERLLVAMVFRNLPHGVEEVRRILGACPDYNAETTNKHIASLTGNPPRCTTIINSGTFSQVRGDTYSAICTRLCDEIQRRDGRSPVAFAYRCASYVFKQTGGSLPNSSPNGVVP